MVNIEFLATSTAIETTKDIPRIIKNDDKKYREKFFSSPFAFIVGKYLGTAIPIAPSITYAITEEVRFIIL